MTRVKKAGAFLRTHWRTIAVAAWLAWASANIIDVRDDAASAAVMSYEIQQINSRTEEISDKLQTLQKDINHLYSEMRYR